MKNLVAALFLVTAAPAFADDRTALIEQFGSVSIAPQLCGVEIDRERLAERQRELVPQGTVDIFTVNNRLATESRGWDEAERTLFCSAQRTFAATLGVLR